ncbi:MAG: pyridoxal phosphate-dependent aminotransferase [Deltaproteobacteria bacterium]|jgi:aspartate aminotransferase|nr:pyridoxal phosphate-dependent aminotransferase [Deltaproteobacteria bacterium]
MALISRKIAEALANGSMVRKMFEVGRELKAKHGAEKVFDYSLGNPDPPPPPAFHEKIRELLAQNRPGLHGYMPNAGWPEVREKVAAYLSQKVPAGVPSFTPDNIVMTVGAAGALNAILKSLLDPGDEVIVLAPYFMEYAFYVDNHGGILKVAETDPSFRPDPEALLAAMGPRTRAVLVNSPNNPTGAIYTAAELRAVGEALTLGSAKTEKPIFLISDEPYRKINFTGTEAPWIFAAYPYSVMATSFSKDLSIPGERLGYAAIHPGLESLEGAGLSAALTLANRVLGSVSAPSLAQLAVCDLLEIEAGAKIYERRSALLSRELRALGYTLTPAEGTFYLFPQSPIPDDLAFVDFLRESLVLAVPGAGFGRRGYFRLSLCLDEGAIERSLPGFARARKLALARA